MDLLVSSFSSLYAPLLVEAQHPVKDLQPNTIQASQHVLPCPYDLALGVPPLKRLPTRVLALPIACNLPRGALPAAHPHAIPHLARRLRAGLATRLLRTRRLSSADVHGVFFFEHNEHISHCCSRARKQHQREWASDNNSLDPKHHQYQHVVTSERDHAQYWLREK